MDSPYWLWLMSLVMVFEVETPHHCIYEPRTSMRRSSRKCQGSFSWLEGLVERAEGLYKIQGASRRSKNIYTVKWVKENHLLFMPQRGVLKLPLDTSEVLNQAIGKTLTLSQRQQIWRTNTMRPHHRGWDMEWVVWQSHTPERKTCRVIMILIIQGFK